MLGVLTVCFIGGAGRAVPAAEKKPTFTILFTAEVHAALLPCDCPLQPLGGVARRATLIERYRKRGPVLLLDAGGWAAGGLYDEESDGDLERDRLRSELMAKAMGLMKYDAVLTGGTVDLSYLRPDDPKWKPDAALSMFFEAGIRDTPLTKLSGRSKSFRIQGTEVVVTDVFEPLKNGGTTAPVPAWVNSKRKNGLFTIMLSRWGEERLGKEAAQHGRNADLIINAGRKTTPRVSWTVGSSVIANFDYQARKLGVADVFPRAGWKPGDPGPRWKIRVQQVPLTPEIPDDPKIAALLKPHLETLRKKSKKKITIEYWHMADCPYCAKLFPVLDAIGRSLGERVSIEPHFVVSKRADGTFRSLHGETELAENRIQALVYKYYPEKFWAWLRWRKDAKNRFRPWREGARKLGLLRARIRGALAAGEADAILERDYRLSLRRRVEGTPTLVIANRTYDGEYQRRHILRALCGLLEKPKPEVCQSVPKCFFDAQCKKRGYIGKCRDKGTPKARCDFSRQAVKVPATVLVEPEALWSNHERILQVLLDYLPGLEWRIVDPASARGRALVKRLRIERFPAYVLGKAAQDEAGFAENLARTVAVREGGIFVVKPQTVGAHRIVARPRIRGRADLFVSRFSKAGQQAVDVALAWIAQGRNVPEIAFHDALYWKEEPQAGGRVQRQIAARGGRAEIEEAAIALAVRRVAPGKFLAYLKERGKRRASLFWDRALEAAGIEVASVRALAEGPDRKGPVKAVLGALGKEADLLQALGTSGDVVFLGENCELIPLRSRADLRYYLERIGRRRTKKEERSPAPAVKVK